MTPERRERLAQIMAAMAVDRSAVFALTTEFHDELARTVRAVMRADNHELTVNEVNDLVMDAALELMPIASSWRPEGGALPWTWAKERIRSVLRARVFGPIPVDPNDIAQDGTAADGGECSQPIRPFTEPDLLGALTAACDRSCHGSAVQDVLMNDVSERDLGVYLEFLIQQDSGDPSPSNTVADMTGLTPANVRQIVKRVRAKVQACLQATTV